MRKNDKEIEDTLLVKMYGSNPSIQCQIRRFKRLGGLGRGRNQEGGGRNESSLSKGNLAVGFESMLGARIHGSELRAKIHGSKVGATDLGAELGAKICGSEVSATSTPPRMACCARPGTSKPRSVAPRRVTSEP